MVLIPARTSAAFPLKAGQSLRVINTHGSQVVDTWLLADGGEYASMAHTRAGLLRLTPRVGDAILSNRRRPIATFLEDTSGGVHDTLIPACDQQRYTLLGHSGPHHNCADNFIAACSRAGLPAIPVPDPLNLFMNVPVAAQGRLAFEPPISKPGDFVTIRAEMALTLIVSACPQDLVPVNGSLQSPREVEVEILPETA